MITAHTGHSAAWRNIAYTCCGKPREHVYTPVQLCSARRAMPCMRRAIVFPYAFLSRDQTCTS